MWLLELVVEKAATSGTTEENTLNSNADPQASLQATTGTAEYNTLNSEYASESEAEAGKVLVNLRKLRVEFCSNLVSLGEKEEVFSGYNIIPLRRFVLPNRRRAEAQVSLDPGLQEAIGKGVGSRRADKGAYQLKHADA
ncbi:hypothetical protein L2E82_45231 [Cichorium intybus]|uniref:Uncharacterized protein n=1 Tax=Cichorium intybus TaxID=13427 RepID=A0ACB8ZSF2_CICIN|nr:hypothetical protein L2E82_45231 [Cichorium intybus]